MKIRVGYEMIYDFPQPTPMIMVLGTHFTRAYLHHLHHVNEIHQPVGADHAVSRRFWQLVQPHRRTGRPHVPQGRRDGTRQRTA